MIRSPMIRTAKPHSRRRWGGALTEFAVMTPFLALLVFGMLEMAQGMRMRHAMSEAGRKGARTAAMPNTSTSAIQTDVKNTLKARGVNPDHVDVTVYVNDTVAEAKTAKKNDKISVKVSAEVGKMLWFTYLLNRKASASETMVMMRQG